jgi:flagellar operon protein
MTDRMNIGRLYPNSVPPGVVRKGPLDNQTRPQINKPFNEVLQDQLIKFSHHAETRLQQRGIRLKSEELAKIGNAVDKAAAKGAKESLIVLNDVALIVNIKNRTVITAMDGSSLRDNVFTQIDSAVIVS